MRRNAPKCTLYGEHLERRLISDGLRRRNSSNYYVTDTVESLESKGEEQIDEDKRNPGWLGHQLSMFSQQQSECVASGFALDTSTEASLTHDLVDRVVEGANELLKVANHQLNVDEPQERKEKEVKDMSDVNGAQDRPSMFESRVSNAEQQQQQASMPNNLKFRKWIEALATPALYSSDLHSVSATTTQQPATTTADHEYLQRCLSIPLLIDHQGLSATGNAEWVPLWDPNQSNATLPYSSENYINRRLAMSLWF